jgi:putative permease
MLDYIKQWYYRHFSDPQVIILALMLISLLLVVVLLGDLLAPIIAAVVLAYVLEGGVWRMVRLKIPRTIAVGIVMLILFVLCFFVFFGVAPLLTRQLTQLGRELPVMLVRGQEYLLLLPEIYPTIFSEQQIHNLIDVIRGEMLSMGQALVSVSMARVIDVFTFLIYLFVVPIMVFFGLKDKAMIVTWFEKFLPQKRELTKQVWHEVDLKIGSYIRGKVIEILIIWGICYLVFEWMGLNYSMLLSFLVGISVIIPYVGAVVVTVPIAIIAYFQWGFVADFWYLMGAYMVIQILDGNLLVPLLFSEVVNLHPVAILASILIFGGIWGMWGVFFAIPLATLVDAVINAWPKFDEPRTAANEDSTVEQSNN